MLSDRKYQGSYQRIAALLQQRQLPGENLHRYFEQVAFSVMVRNGAAHLKNFGLLYRFSGDAWLAPMFDVVCAAVYRYARWPGGPELEDRTPALKPFAGRHRTRSYPTTEELLAFGHKVCRLAGPRPVRERIAEARQATLDAARSDDRVPPALLQDMRSAWETGMLHVR